MCSLNWPNRRRPELSVFHLLWQCTFLGIDGSSVGCSSSGYPQTGWEAWRKRSVVLLCFLSPAMSPDWRIEVELNEHPRWNKNSFQLYGIATWPIIQALSNSHQCALEWNFEKSCSTGTSFCCFHDKCVESSPRLRSLSLHVAGTRFAVLDP